MKLYRIMMVASAVALSSYTSERGLKSQKNTSSLSCATLCQELVSRLRSAGVEQAIWRPFDQNKILSKKKLERRCGRMISGLQRKLGLDGQILITQTEIHKELCNQLSENDPEVVKVWARIAFVTLAGCLHSVGIAILNDVHTRLVNERCQSESLLTGKSSVRINRARTF